MSYFLITTIASDIPTQINNLVLNTNNALKNLNIIKNNRLQATSEIMSLNESSLKDLLREYTLLLFFAQIVNDLAFAYPNNNIILNSKYILYNILSQCGSIVMTYFPNSVELKNKFINDEVNTYFNELGKDIVPLESLSVNLEIHMIMTNIANTVISSYFDYFFITLAKPHLINYINQTTIASINNYISSLRIPLINCSYEYINNNTTTNILSLQNQINNICSQISIINNDIVRSISLLSPNLQNLSYIIFASNIAASQLNGSQQVAASNVAASQLNGSQQVAASNVAASQLNGSQQVAESQLYDSQQVAESQLYDSQQVAESQLYDSQQVAASNVAASQLYGSHQVAESQLYDSQQVAASQLYGSHQVAESQLYDSQQVAASQLYGSQQVAASNVAASQLYDSQQIAASQLYGSQLVAASQLYGSQQVAASNVAASQLYGSQLVAASNVAAYAAHKAKAAAINGSLSTYDLICIGIAIFFVIVISMLVLIYMGFVEI